ncbi:MAG: hypothetical protein R2731_05045 [Nocardioides sp.]
MSRKERPGPATRRTGYVIAVLVNAALLVVVNRWPGWDAVPFLTGDTERVLELVNLSLIVSIVANVLYVVADPPWFKALGDIATTGVGLAAVLRVWQVFPFDFGDASFPWGTLTRVLLVVAAVGSAIGIMTAASRLVTGLGRRG